MSIGRQNINSVINHHTLLLSLLVMYFCLSGYGTGCGKYELTYNWFCSLLLIACFTNWEIHVKMN